MVSSPDELALPPRPLARAAALGRASPTSSPRPCPRRAGALPRPPGHGHRAGARLAAHHPRHRARLRARFLALRAGHRRPVGAPRHVARRDGGDGVVRRAPGRTSSASCLVKHERGRPGPPAGGASTRARAATAVRALLEPRSRRARARSCSRMVTRARPRPRRRRRGVGPAIHADRPVARAAVIRQLRAGDALPRARALDRARPGARRRRATRSPIPRARALLAERFGAPLDVHPEAGHELALDAPEWLADARRRVVAARARTGRPTAPGVRLGSLGGRGPPPARRQPRRGRARGGARPGPAGARRASSWLASTALRPGEAHRARRHPGCAASPCDDAPAFERVARAVEPGLKNDYLGTSPRNALTGYVFSASELPPLLPDPRALRDELRPAPAAPALLLLPPPVGGPGRRDAASSTSARVYRDLDPDVRARFARARRAQHPQLRRPRAAAPRLDLWKLKRWDEMFGTTDRAAVEARCRENGFDSTWGPAGGLRLTNVQPAVQAAPGDGRAGVVQPRAGLPPLGRARRVPAHRGAAGPAAATRRSRGSPRPRCAWQAARRRRRPGDALHLRRRHAHPGRRHGRGARRHLEEHGVLPLAKGRRARHRQRRGRPRAHALPRAAHGGGGVGLERGLVTCRSCRSPRAACRRARRRPGCRRPAPRGTRRRGRCAARPERVVVVS